VLHIAFGETDDWAHEHRYDRLLASIGYFDRSLRKLWEALQSMPEYRGRTTMIVTSDHGRGGTLEDYGSHGAKVAGAEQIWLAAIGPDTPAKGEVETPAEVFQRDIAPTMIRLMGLDASAYAGATGKPISAVMR
jgi:bisphosphoglycerate-independent phosphoglycerate mutase (AlkP superfamily)